MFSKLSTECFGHDDLRGIWAIELSNFTDNFLLRHLFLSSFYPLQNFANQSTIYPLDSIKLRCSIAGSCNPLIMVLINASFSNYSIILSSFIHVPTAKFGLELCPEVSPTSPIFHPMFISRVRSTDFIQYAHARFHHTFMCLLCSCLDRLLSSSTLVKIFRFMMMRSDHISQCAKDLSALALSVQAISQFMRCLDLSYS